MALLPAPRLLDGFVEVPEHPLEPAGAVEGEREGLPIMGPPCEAGSPRRIQIEGEASPA